MDSVRLREAPASNTQSDSGCSVSLERFLCTGQRDLCEQAEGDRPPHLCSLLVSCSSHSASPVVLRSMYMYRWHQDTLSATGFQLGTSFHRRNMLTHVVHI